mmetsp:Transcript_14620/g.41891  ORF Transcript_14620/g.41891 Transcript_14620/m.41891 type:complete len:202 (-) Transcript_14620:316-921(-)
MYSGRSRSSGSLSSWPHCRASCVAMGTSRTWCSKSRLTRARDSSPGRERNASSCALVACPLLSKRIGCCRTQQTLRLPGSKASAGKPADVRPCLSTRAICCCSLKKVKNCSLRTFTLFSNTDEEKSSARLKIFGPYALRASSEENNPSVSIQTTVPSPSCLWPQMSMPRVNVCCSWPTPKPPRYGARRPMRRFSSRDLPPR